MVWPFVGDVSGKGTAAGVFGSLAIGTMANIAEHPCPPRNAGISDRVSRPTWTRASSMAFAYMDAANAGLRGKAAARL